MKPPELDSEDEEAAEEKRKAKLASLSHSTNPFNKKASAKVVPEIPKPIPKTTQTTYAFEAQVLPLYTIEPSWITPPREYATLVADRVAPMSDHGIISLQYIGGMNYDTVKEVSELRITSYGSDDSSKLRVQWNRIDYDCEEKVQPMMSNSAVTYQDKVYMFAGCFMYNRKRQIRESVSTVSVFDRMGKPSLKKVDANSTFLIRAKKNHCAFVFGKSYCLIK